MKPKLSIDPRVKLLLFVVTSLFVMKCTSMVLNLLLGSYIAFLLVVGGKAAFALKSYPLFLLGLLAGESLHGWLHGIPGVLCLSICVILRMLVPIVMAFTLVFQTTTISQFMAAFQKMHVPVKIIIPFAVMFRFVPTVQEEWNCIRRAMAFRGIALHIGGVVRHPVSSVEHILVPLLFSAVAVMEELAAASLARGLDSECERTSLVEVRMNMWDYIFLMGVLTFAVFWIFLK